MFTPARNSLKHAAASTLAVLIAISTPALANEMAEKLGPVGPHEPILVTVGNKRIIAFYVSGGGGCNLDAVVWNDDDPDATTAIRVRISLAPAQGAFFDSPENKSLILECGNRADTLAGRLSSPPTRAP
jgi:hypothetical protein